MADKMWDILRFLKNPDGEDAPGETTLHSENEKKQINDQLMAALEHTERAIDDVIENENPDTLLTEISRPAENPEAFPQLTDLHADTQNQQTDSELLEAEKEVGNAETPAEESTPTAENLDTNTLDAATMTGIMDVQGHGDETLLKISVARVKPNPFQPRKIMGENEITELSQSIKELGVLQPILVRQVGNAYELIAGERRLRAAQRAGLTEIPAMVVATQPLTQQIIALVENIQRKNLSAIEEAMCLQDIISKTGWSQTELSRRTGRSQASIANKLRLLRLDQSVQDLVISGKLGERQARSLLSLSVEEQRMLAQKAIDEDLSARALELLSESWHDGKKTNRRNEKRSQEATDGPAGELLGDLATLINKHRNRGISAQWKVKQMDQSALVVEISVDFLGNTAVSQESDA
ncbi:ParB/RepB/Spo0J family partition protein [Synergistaceae bacterium OttesenSCG-928-I11]|nr:ParB/RepB/Spo0J family partition protein [Synergistaceae bacterium OttesenSCG-928-I11]